MLKRMMLIAALLAADALAAPAPYRVAQYDVAWYDAARQREVAARIYAPANAPGPLPVNIFSHRLVNPPRGPAPPPAAPPSPRRHGATRGFVSTPPGRPAAPSSEPRHGLWHLSRAG